MGASLTLTLSAGTAQLTPFKSQTVMKRFPEDIVAIFNEPIAYITFTDVEKYIQGLKFVQLD